MAPVAARAAAPAGPLAGSRPDPAARTMHDSKSSSTGAWRDWWRGTRNVDLWWTLARYDILLRYRRSMLGPLWITLSMGAMLLGMGPLYAVLLNQPLNRFYPYLTLGIIFWHFFSATLNEGCQVFIVSAPYLKQAQVSCSVFVWRSLTRQVIQLAHHIVLYLPVAWYCGVRWNPDMLLFIPWFLLVLVNLHALVLILGVVSARFRDVPQIVASVLQLLMFLTPVFWVPDVLTQETVPARTRFILYNPLAQMLDVLRLPLLGDRPASGTCWFLLDFTLLSVAVAAVLYATQRRRIVYWV